MEKINLKFLIIGLLVLLPIFVSIGNNGISLSRVAYYDNHKYFISLPISTFFVLFFFKKYVIQAFLNLIFSKVFLIISLILIIHFITNLKFDYLFHKHIFSILFFLFIINASELYFYKKLYFINIIKRMNIYDYLCIYPAFIHIFIVAICLEYYGRPSYLHNDIIIFNFEQYFSIAFIPALYVYRKFFFRNLIWGLIIFINFKTNNNTAYLMFFLYVCLLLLPIKSLATETQLNIIKIIMYFLVVFGTFYWVFEINDYFSKFLNQGGYVSRVNVLESFWLSLNFYNFFLPFLGTDRIFNNAEYHNQYLNFYHTFGIFSLYFFWKLVQFTLKIYKINKRLAFLIIVIFSLGSITINTIMHPYLMIYFAILIGFLSANINLNNENKKIIIK